MIFNIKVIYNVDNEFTRNSHDGHYINWWEDNEAQTTTPTRRQILFLSLIWRFKIPNFYLTFCETRTCSIHLIVRSMQNILSKTDYNFINFSQWVYHKICKKNHQFYFILLKILDLDEIRVQENRRSSRVKWAKLH